MEFPFLNKKSVQKVSILVLLLTVTTLIILSSAPIYVPFSRRYQQPPAAPGPPCSAEEKQKLITVADRDDDDYKCDIFVGEWVPNPDAPYYTNTTCWAIHEHQNCMKYGRPDDEFMKWKWKPEGCELPVFNPYQFLDMMTGKSMAFVGDSVGRNHMQSLICLLSRVEFPIDDSGMENVDDYFRRWKYPTYNFTLAAFWTTYLVRSQQVEGEPKLFNLHLDEFDEKWTAKIQDFDYVIINTGQWFFNPTMYSENNRLVGCHRCDKKKNIPELPMTYGFRRAWKTAFRAIRSKKNQKSVTFLRTYAPSHFEGGDWNKGGNCLRKRPFRSNETTLGGESLELYLTQLEEFRLAEEEWRKQGLRLRLLDATQAMLLRPDGHPNKYGHWPNANVTLYNDCVHWCLPGPIDTWNDFLLHMLKMEGRRSHEEKLMLKRKEKMTWF